MSKQGQHPGDSNDQNKSHGHNNPSQSQTIITGSNKKHETYERQAREHKDTSPQPQAAKNDWNEDTRDKPSIEDAPRDRNADDRGDSRRSGSESNAGQ